MKRFLVVLLFSLCGLTVKSQQISEDLDLTDSTQTHYLETKRGDRFIGRITKIENTQVYFLFRENQEIIFQLSELERIDIYDPNQGIPSDNFVPTFITFFPTAYNLKKGEFEYQNISILWNTFSYGVSDQFSLGGGFIIPIAFVLKFRAGTPISDKIQLGLNTNTIVPLVSDSEAISFFNLNLSLGTPDQFVNFGGGYAFSWGFPEDSGGFVSLGGSTRIGQKIGLNGDLNFLFIDDDNYFFGTFGFNYFGKRNRIGLGILFDTSEDIIGTIGVPLVSFSQRF